MFNIDKLYKKKGENLDLNAFLLIQTFFYYILIWSFNLNQI